MKLFIIIIMSFCIVSCSKKQPVEKIDDQQLLAKALELRNFIEVKSIIKGIKTTENTQNIIALYSQLEVDSLVKLDINIEYLKQFYSQMSEPHQYMLDEMTKWVYLKQIYQHEVSPPIRILQREELYLAPSEVDFAICPNEKEDCAQIVRDKLTKQMSNDEIRYNLTNMATKDPCVNLSKRLQGQLFANKCLKKNKGHLKVTLLNVPSFNKNRWMQVFSSDN